MTPDSLSPPNNDATQSYSAQRKCWRRFALLVLLVQCTLFWEGCENQQTLLSVGLAGPVATIGYGDSTKPTSLVDFSLPCLIANLLAMAAAVALLVYAPQRWAGPLGSRRLLIATAIVTTIFNSILYFSGMWMYLVMTPIFWLAENVFRDVLATNRLLGMISRGYFVFSIAVVWGLLWLVQTIGRRYFFIHADRWQFSLGGLFVAMVLLGTALGMLLRLLSS